MDSVCRPYAHCVQVLPPIYYTGMIPISRMISLQCPLTKEIREQVSPRFSLMAVLAEQEDAEPGTISRLEIHQQVPAWAHLMDMVTIIHSTPGGLLLHSL